jgi:hypothetical protein
MAALDLVEIKQVAKRYGSERALAGVTLELRAASMCALLGHNGAGKTTLLGVVSTLVRPNKGAVTYRSNGTSIEGEAVRREIGLLARNHCATPSSARSGPAIRGPHGVDPAPIPLLDRVGLGRAPAAPRARTRAACNASHSPRAAHETMRAALDGRSPASIRRRPRARRAMVSQGERGVVVVTHDLEAIAGRTVTSRSCAAAARVRRTRRLFVRSAQRPQYRQAN